MIDSAIILGNHIQALGIARIIKKLGAKVIVFSDTSISVVRASNCCDKFHIYQSHDELLEKMLHYASKNCLVFATSDDLVHFVSLNYTLLNQKFSLFVASPEIVEVCYNKRITYEVAEKIGVPVPLSWFPNNKTELLEIVDSIPYPVIIKPAVMHTFHKATGKKAFMCSNKEELMLNYEKALEVIPSEEIIIQEFLSGGAKDLFSFGCFVVNGDVKGSLCVNRIRQNPMTFGNSTCFALSKINQPYEEDAKKFLAYIHYFGLAEVEFMYDEKTGLHKMLEINPRAWKWHYIAKALDVELIKLGVDFFNGQPVQETKNKLQDIAWIESITDCYVVAKEIFAGRMKWKDYITSLKKRPIHAVWDVNDLKPALYYLFMLPILYIKRS